MTIPMWRRFALALGALAIAGVLFRGHIAAAIITRGDDALRHGDRTAAVRYYRRALTIDGRSATAADRLAFYLDERRARGDAATAVDVVTRALAAAPDDAALFADRAFAEQQLHRWPAAESDFARAAVLGHDARYDHLAGRIALARGKRAAARAYFRLALRYDPRFDPARAALARFR